MRGKNTKRSIILCVFLFHLFFCLEGFGQFEQRVDDKLWITIPKNISVFHILVILTPSGEAMKKYYEHPLHLAAYNYFQESKEHPAVQVTDQIFKKYHYFAFNYISFYYSGFPDANLRSDIVLPPEYTNDENMKRMIEKYVVLVKDFYSSTKFEAFWESHQDDLLTVLKEMQGNMPQFDFPEMMESFYNRRVERFYFVPCPFMKTMGTHVEVQDGDGNWTFYYIAGGNIFNNKFSNISTAFHEFSHCFIEPISAEYSEQIYELDYLYKPLKNDLSKMGYQNWDRGFNEHMVRAAEILLLRKAFGEEIEMKKLGREKRIGFQLIERFYGYFRDYDERRNVYQDLKAYYPIILKDLTRLRVEEYRRPGIMGFYPEYRENKLYIKNVVANSTFDAAGLQEGDILFSIENMEIHSEENFNEAKGMWWNHTKEGDSVRVCYIRDGERMVKNITVPFITDYKYLFQ